MDRYFNFLITNNDKYSLIKHTSVLSPLLLSRSLNLLPLPLASSSPLHLPSSSSFPPPGGGGGGGVIGQRWGAGGNVPQADPQSVHLGSDQSQGRTRDTERERERGGWGGGRERGRERISVLLLLTCFRNVNVRLRCQ